MRKPPQQQEGTREVDGDMLETCWKALRACGRRGSGSACMRRSGAKRWRGLTAEHDLDLVLEEGGQAVQREDGLKPGAEGVHLRAGAVAQAGQAWKEEWGGVKWGYGWGRGGGRGCGWAGGRGITNPGKRCRR